MDENYVKKCFGTKEFGAKSYICRVCEVREECMKVNPKRLRLK